MGIIADLTPLNLAEEKEKFFTDFSYNPQFVYSRTFTKEELLKYNLPNKKLYHHSLNLIDKHGLQPINDKKPLSEELVKELCDLLFTQLKIEPIPVSFSPNHIAKAMINAKGLNFKIPITITKEQLLMTLDHEIQSHFLRKNNQQLLEKSVQEKNNDIFNDENDTDDFRITEEGIANIHSYISAKNKVMRKTYTNYIGAYVAFNNSFAEAFSQMVKLGTSKRLAWEIVLKKKRGLTDTSLKGGSTKDTVYLEGSIMVWKWLRDRNNDPKDLYLGRIGLSQISNYKKEYEKIGNINLTYPLFFSDMKKYRDNLEEIGKVNLFEELI